MINHHPSEATLGAYAFGTLPEALALVVATHLTQCGSCRHIVGALEAVGGAMLEQVPAAQVSSDALQRLLARIDEPHLVKPPPVINPDLPPPINRVGLGRWWPIGRGVHYRPMQSAGSAWGGLVLAKPGRGLPRHAHAGLELTCILSGAFTDSGGLYRPGDLAEPEGDHDHPPVVVGAEPCLCVIASEGMRLRGLLGLAQRMIMS